MTPHDQSARGLARRINESPMLRLSTFQCDRPNGLDEGMLTSMIAKALHAAHDAGVKEGLEKAMLMLFAPS